MRHIFDLCLLVVFRSFLWRNFHVTELEALIFYGRNQSRYSSNEFISECLSIFSEVLQEMQDSELDVANSCLPISVMWDESESVGQVEELITYVSWIDRNTLQKKTAFLNICDVKSQTAEEIEKNIVRTLIQNKLIARVIGGGLDGMRNQYRHEKWCGYSATFVYSLALRCSLHCTSSKFGCSDCEQAGRHSLPC